MGSFRIPEPNQSAISGTPVVFTIENTAEEELQARLSIPSDPAQLEIIKIPLEKAAKSEWFTFDGPRERGFAASTSSTVAVTANVPAGTKPGDYLFCLQIASVVDPDNDSARSPVVTLTVGEAPVVVDEAKPKPKWWLWLLIALVVLAVLGGVGYAIFGRKDKDKPAEEAAPVSGGAWFVGSWSGTIDGRAATMTWTDRGEKARPRYAGQYSLDGGQTSQKLDFVSVRSNEFNFKSSTHPWQLTKVSNQQLTGWASFDGQRYPIALRK